MHKITPIKAHFDEQLPAEPGETPDFWRVELQVERPFEEQHETEVRQPGDYVWVADFPSAREATRYVAFLGEGAASGALVSPNQAAEALDSLDDCARMNLGVDAHGPRSVLERFIAQSTQVFPEGPVC